MSKTKDSRASSSVAFACKAALLASSCLAFAPAAIAADTTVPAGTTRTVTGAGTTPGATGPIGASGADNVTVEAGAEVSGSPTANAGALVLISGATTGVVIDNAGTMINGNTAGGSIIAYQTGSGSTAQSLQHDITIFNRAGALMESGNGPITFGSTAAAPAASFSRDQNSIYVIDNAGIIRNTRTNTLGAINMLYLNASGTSSPSVTIYNRAGGTISSPNDAVRVGTSIIDNAGTITGSTSVMDADGIDVRGNDASAVIINRTGGVIEGGARGIVGGGNVSYVAGDSTVFSTSGLVGTSYQSTVRHLTITNEVGATIRGGLASGSTGAGVATTSGVTIDNAGTIQSGGGSGISVGGTASPNAIVASTIILRSGSTLIGGNGTAISLTNAANPDDTVIIEAGAVVSGSINLGGGSDDTINLEGAGDGALNGVISGVEKLNVNSASWTLTADSNGADTTILSGATLSFGNGGTTGLMDGAITNNGALIVNRSNQVTQSATGLISGTGSLSHTGTGSFVLAAGNSYSGATNITSGVLQAGAVNALAANSAHNVASGATLDLDGFDNTVASLAGAGSVTLGAGTLTIGGNASTTFSGVISGSGGVTYGGTGTLTLSGANTYTGTTTLTSGTLVNSGALAGAISATNATITNNGSGVTDLTLVNSTYTGSGAISGNVVVDGSNATLGTTVGGNVDVGNMGQLFGGQDISGTLSIADGGALSPGIGGIGTLNVGALALSGNSILDFDFGAPDLPPGIGNDYVNVAGNLTLDGILNINNVGAMGPGIYTIFTYGGSLTDNGLAFGTLPSGLAAGDFSVQTSVTGQVNIVSSGSPGAGPPAALQFWDGGNPANFDNGVVNGGSGIWSTSGAPSWALADGTGNNVWGSGFAIFQAASGTVTIATSVDATGLQFASEGYTITGGTLNLNEATSIVRIDDATHTATIDSAVGGTGNLTLRGAGTLVLAGANTNSGATAIEGGTLRVEGGQALSDTAVVTITSPGRLQLGAAETIGGLVGSGSVDLETNALTLANSTDAVYAGIVSGAGSLIYAGSAVQTLSGANTYSGGTTVDSGTLRAGSTSAFGSGGATIATGATLSLGTFATSLTTIAGSGTIALGTATLTLGGTDANSVFGGVITGTGGLIKAGSGTLALNGASTYSGGTAINAGTLEMGNAAALGTGSVDLASGTTLNVNAANATLGALTLGGGANVNLNDNAATVASLAGAGDITLGTGALRLNTAGSVTHSGVIAGVGSVTMAGMGSQTLAGANTFTGGTNVTNGTLVTGSGTALGTGPVAVSAGATLNLNGNDTSLSALNGAGAVQLGAGALTLGQGNSSSTFAGIISGTGSLTKAGTGTVTLNGASTYAGGTSINAGTLVIGNASALGTGLVAIASGATLDVNNVNAVFGSLTGSGNIALGSGNLTLGQGNASSTYAGAISGAGSVTKAGTGTLTLTGSHSFTGGLAIDGGSLVNNGNIASTVTVGTGGKLGGTGSVGALTVNGRIAPGNSIGTLAVNGALTLASSSIFEVEVDQLGAADRIAATGAVTLAGGAVSVLAASETPTSRYGNSNSYTIVTGSSVSGTFGAISSNLAFLTPSLSYSGTAVTLNLMRNDADLSTAAVTANQASVADVIQAFGPASTIYLDILGLSAAGAAAAFDQLSGEIYASAPALLFREGAAVRRIVQEQAQAGAAASMDGTHFWIDYLDGSATQSSDDTARVDRDGQGYMIGVDHGFGPIRLGVTYGRTEADFTSAMLVSGGKTSSDYFTAYAAGRWGRFAANAGVSYAEHDLEVARTVSFGLTNEVVASRTQGSTTQVFGELSYALFNGGVRIEPFAGFAMQVSKFGGGTESGGTTALVADKTSLERPIVNIGVRGHAELTRNIILRGSVSDQIVRQSSIERDLSFASGGQGFTVSSTPIGSHGLTADVGVEARFGSLAIGVSYVGERSSTYDSDAVRANVRLRF